MWYLENKEHEYKWYTFRQQHTSGYNQRRVGYFLIFTDLRGFIQKPNDLVVFSTDPSIIFSLWVNCERIKVNDAGNTIILYVKILHAPKKMKNHIKITLEKLKNENITDEKSYLMIFYGQYSMWKIEYLMQHCSHQIETPGFSFKQE